ncbi:50S ribosomal protein L29 [uncultured Sunxiuqinia sp.]|jgi:large subunit ribosomal protein L29|uniref:50S ribosomal protein L29 n=1 Tax=uncultured Sunxiuqinia sp. TaxID=1573825 RepID=UPI0030DC69F6|tara:strand:+ start:7320 stop:7526 length:207 start_codon:yes stop_codon:yes gene_type:complete
MMKASEIKELTDKEILERIQLEKETLARLNMNHAVSPLDNPMKIKETRKNIARLQTIRRQRELNQNQN